MDLSKPYLRMVRNDYYSSFIEKRYAPNMQILCRSYNIIENDLKRLFEYIEPCDNNRKTYSHRTFELLLRAATEYEMNCKEILLANEYNKKTNLNNEDYYLINEPSKLFSYKVKINFWQPEPLLLQPFDSWSDLIYKPLDWYQGYNNVKHNRNSCFNEASLENVIKAVSAVLIILFSQFGHIVFSPYHEGKSWIDEDDEGGIFDNSMMFTIYPPKWAEEEKYLFDWDLLKNTTEPYNKYPFV